MRLSIFAFHVQCIATDIAPTKFTLMPCEGVKAYVEIAKSTGELAEAPIWDQVTINGKWCGNRCGGVRAFAEMVEKAKPEITFD